MDSELLHEMRMDIKKLLADVAVLKSQKDESTAMRSWTVPALVAALVSWVMKGF